jgi:hypothetical protein
LTRYGPPRRPVNPAEYAVETTNRIVTVVWHDLGFFRATAFPYSGVLDCHHYKSGTSFFGIDVRFHRYITAKERKKEYLRRRFCTTVLDLVAPTHYETRRSQRDTHGVYTREYSNSNTFIFIQQTYTLGLASASHAPTSSVSASETCGLEKVEEPCEDYELPIDIQPSSTASGVRPTTDSETPSPYPSRGRTCGL